MAVEMATVAARTRMARTQRIWGNFWICGMLRPRTIRARAIRTPNRTKLIVTSTDPGCGIAAA